MALRELGFDAVLNEETGELLLRKGDDGALYATGYILQVTPVYPWPMSLVWNQNAGQFATLASTGKVRDKMRAASPMMRDLIKMGWEFKAVEAPAVRVGPFTWGKAGMIEARYKGEYKGRYNAGLAIQTAVRENHRAAFAVIWTDITRQVNARAMDEA